MGMRRAWLLHLFVLSLVPTVARGADGRVEALGVAEIGVASLVPALEAEGARAIRSDGSAAADIWLSKDVPKLEDGAFLGVVRLTREGHDVRERSVPAGTYTLRYSSLPAGDRHGGCQRNPEFAVLIRATDDPEAGRRLAYDEMMTLSAQILGRRHPVVWQIGRGRGGGVAPGFHEQPPGLAWMVVSLSVGGTRVPFIVYLRGSLSR